MCDEHLEYYKQSVAADRQRNPRSRVEDAICELQKDPTAVDATMELAFSYIGVSDYAKAKELFEGLVASGVNDARLYYGLAAVIRLDALEKGELQNACEQILALYDKIREHGKFSFLSDAQLLMDSGFPERAATVLRELLELQPNALAEYHYARALFQSGKLEESIGYFERAIKNKIIRAKDGDMQSYADALKKVGRLNEASAVESKLVKCLPSHGPAFRGYYRPLPDALVDKLEILYSLERTILGRYHLDNEYPIYSIEDMSKIVCKSPTFCQHQK